MACYYPNLVYQRYGLHKFLGAASKFPNYDPEYVTPVPCGQCVGCRLARSAEWALRCMHEKIFYENSCFVTLTYSDDHLPVHVSDDGSVLVTSLDAPGTASTLSKGGKSCLTLFFKRLRKKYGKNIRYFACGEYGDKSGRAHYHVILYGVDFVDRVFYKKQNDQVMYVSPSLDKIWGKGICVIGDLTFESAAYTARYIMKKQTGKKSVGYYAGRVPEFTVNSNGLGRRWFEKYGSDAFDKDLIYYQGRKMKPPKYYMNLFELTEPEKADIIKMRRRELAMQDLTNQTPERLAVRERVLKKRTRSLIRPLD